MKKKTNIRDIVKDFLEGGEVLTEAPVDAQKVMQDFMAQKYGKKAIVGSDEWNAEQARREAEKEKAAAEAQQPLPKDKLDAQIERLRQLMQRHDWFYQYSDEYRIWQAGNKSDGNIRSLASQLRKRGHDKEVSDLYAQYDQRRKK